MKNDLYFNITTSGPTLSGILYQRVKPSIQTVSYRTGDAGWHWLNGTYNWTTPTSPLYNQQLDYTQAISTFGKILLYNNVFGNKIRFTGSSGGYAHNNGSIFYDYLGSTTTKALAFPDSIIIDNLTGLAWFIPDTTTRPWNTCIDNIHTVNWYGYTDWRLPTIEEVLSWLIYDQNILGIDNNVTNFSPFNPVSYIAQMYTSNTLPEDTTQAFWLTPYSQNRVLVTSKASGVRQYYCRTWF